MWKNNSNNNTNNNNKKQNKNYWKSFSHIFASQLSWYFTH